MARHSRMLIAATLAFAFAATLGADAQALTRHPRHRLVRGGDVVVHTGRSYLDPGPSAAEGTEDRYFYDTAHTDFRSEGPDFTRNTGGFELLPTPYSLPGRQETFGDFN